MKGLWWVFCGAFAAFLCFAHGNLESLDSAATMHGARALWLRGDSGLRAADQGGEWLGELALAGYIEQERLAGNHTYGKRGRNGLTYVWFPIGHLGAMVPLVAAGEALHGAFPEVEARYRATVAPGVPDAALVTNLSYRDNHLVFCNAAVAMVLPPLCGGALVVLVFLIARALGAGARDAGWATAATVMATQCFPLGRETLSDGPGMVCLLTALLAVVRVHQGTAGRAVLLWGGSAAGLAVLTRYAHGFLVPLLGLVVVAAAIRRRQPAMVLWYGLGGLPWAVLLMLVNHSRFGSISDTGYPPFSSWFNYPLPYGLLKLLVAAGKGILWFSPMLWLALPAALRPGQAPQLRWLGLGLFAVPMAMFAMTNGWQSGQCWGARYVTPAVVSLCALVLPQARPWVARPRTFLVLLLLGVVVNLTGVVAPTRGHNQLAGQAVAAMYDHELAAGRITAADRQSVDPADHFFFLPRFSPLHAHWTYAWKSWRGDFEGPDGRPRDGSANTIEPLFGIAAMPGKEGDQGLAPVHWEDRGGRHLWWVFWGELLRVPGGWLLLPVALLAGFASLLGWRRVLAAAADPASR